MLIIESSWKTDNFDNIKNHKQTYVKVIGLEQSNFIADQLATESIGILDSMGLGEPINTLKSLAEYMVNRNK